VAEYRKGRALRTGRVGVLASAFNPPTIAHVALAAAAQSAAGLDQIAFALPRRLPHKSFDGTSFEQRLELLLALTEEREEWACVVTDGGLFVEMAREIKALSGPDVRTLLLCGRDAAERIVGWSYGDAPPIEEQLREFGMVVAARAGEYHPPQAIAAGVVSVELPPECRLVSSSAVRAAIAAGIDWSRLAPPAVAERVRRLGLYGARE
jgi:nicotinic acid mononucleotide adenylyltransferase